MSDTPRRHHPLRCVANGLAMGAADAVPGVSGGTIALLLGFYLQLLESIAVWIGLPLHVRTPQGRQRLADSAAFLVPLGIGLLAAYYVATRILVGSTQDPGLLRLASSAPYFYAGFCGLVLASAVQVWRRIHEPRTREIVLVVTGAVASFVFAGLPHMQGEPPAWALVPGGAGAISVMLLPGVSGSLLLVILGQYTMVSAAVHDRDIGILALFVLGLILGVVTVVPLLRRLLKNHARPTFALLTGLMLGSVRALWPWKSQYDPKAGVLTNHLDVLQAGLPTFLGILVAAVVGVALVVLLDLIERRHAAALAADS